MTPMTRNCRGSLIGVRHSPEMGDGREQREYKRDKARRCSRLVRPLGDRKRDNAQATSICSVSLTTRTGSSSSLRRSVSSRAPGRERGHGICYVSTFYTTLVKKSQEGKGASELRRTPLPRNRVNRGKWKGQKQHIAGAEATRSGPRNLSLKLPHTC
jgi:hypothetical protein